MVFAGNSEGFTVQLNTTKLPTGARMFTGSGPWTRLAAVHCRIKMKTMINAELLDKISIS